jgi:TPP-dependent pyruvate/acetoin dehydrogenase alpha subunit
MASWSVDGMDVLAVERAARDAIDAIRHGGGPHLLELRTFRFRAHSMYDPERYRSKAEVDAWKQRDPIDRFERELRDAGTITDDDVTAIEADVQAEIDRAVAFAEAAEPEPVDTVLRFVQSEATP